MTESEGPCVVALMDSSYLDLTSQVSGKEWKAEVFALVESMGKKGCLTEVAMARHTTRAHALPSPNHTRTHAPPTRHANYSSADISQV
jgi:hypothetical protein